MHLLRSSGSISLFWLTRSDRIATAGGGASGRLLLIRDIQPTDASGEFPGLTIGTDGLPLISYWNRSTEDLRVAHHSSVLGVPYRRGH